MWTNTVFSPGLISPSRDRGGEPGHRLGGVDRVEHEPSQRPASSMARRRGVGQLLVARADLVEVDPQAVRARTQLATSRHRRRVLDRAGVDAEDALGAEAGDQARHRAARADADDHVADVGRVLEDLLARR